MAVLSTTVLVALDPLEQFKKSADSRRKSDLAQIQRALEVYYQDFGEYPYSVQSKISTSTLAADIVDWGQDWRPYIDVLPQDPSGNKRYVYWSDLTRQSYALYASLDRGDKDPQACNDGGACTNALANGLLCSATQQTPCTYGVTSPNIAP